MLRNPFLFGGSIFILLFATIDSSLWLQPSRHDAEYEARTLDGRFNHRSDPELGAAHRPFRRLAPNAATPPERPLPRTVSNAVHAQPNEHWTVPDPKGRSILFAVFGQFLSHDVSLRAKQTRPRFVRVGPDDPMFEEDAVLPFAPSARHPEFGTPYNRVTAWIDGSMIYGSEECRAAALRTFRGGKLRTSAGNRLPKYGWSEHLRLCAPPGAVLAGCAPVLDIENPRREPRTTLYLAGDVRANENPVLLSLHTIFVREHNRYARRLAVQNPAWSDERLYRESRRWVGGLIQSITFNEYLPLLLGPRALPPYSGYDASVAGQVSLEFSGAALRFGHSQMGPVLYRNAPDGGEFEYSDVSLKAAYFATPLYEQADGGPGARLSGAATFRSQPVDRFVIDDLRNYMFGGLQGGLDVATINIAVGREAGLGSLNDIRAAMGLSPWASFGALASDPDVARELESLYPSVDDVDPWVGMLVEASSRSSEPAVEPSITGSTLRAVLVEGFRRLPDGDRFYFENDPGLRGARPELSHTKLADVIRRNVEGAYASSRIAGSAFLAEKAERSR